MNNPELPKSIYEFIYGYIVLPFLIVNFRHMQNIFYYRDIIKANDIRGKIEVPMLLSMRRSAVETFGYFLLYLIIFLLTGAWILAGGATGFLKLLFSHRKWIRYDRLADSILETQENEKNDDNASAK